MTPNRSDQRYLDNKSSAYQRAVPSASKRMTVSMRRAVKSTKDGVDDILERIGYRGDREQAALLLRSSAPMEVTQKLIEDMNRLPEIDRDRLLKRMTADLTSGDMTVRRAIGYTMEVERVNLAVKLGVDMTPVLHDVAVQAYSHSMFSAQKAVGLGFSLGEPPTKLISFMSRSTLSRTALLFQSNSMMAPLKKVIMSGLAKGHTAEQMAVEMRDVSKTSVYKSKAMIRTAITEVANEMEKRTSQDLGLKRYEYAATLDERTCEICGGMDGKVFDLDKAQAGLNFPPMHKNCRCVTVAVLTETAKKDLSRRARDSEGVSMTIPASMTYAQWRAKYVNRQSPLDVE